MDPVFILSQVYMDDSLGDRIWVDRVDCQAFVENVQTAFGTRLPSVNMLASETGVKPESACKSELMHALGFRYLPAYLYLCIDARTFRTTNTATHVADDAVDW